MVKTHEINLITSVFNQVQTSNYIILEQDKDNLFEANDYILFKQVEQVEEGTQFTGLYQIVQIKDVVIDKGLKEGFVLLNMQKI
jgi:hypothetical protein|nr:MAG TPA: activating signal cointegrator [Caudoviricetes sp.]